MVSRSGTRYKRVVLEFSSAVYTTHTSNLSSYTPADCRHISCICSSRHIDGHPRSIFHVVVASLALLFRSTASAAVSRCIEGRMPLVIMGLIGDPCKGDPSTPKDPISSQIAPMEWELVDFRGP